MFCHPGRNLVTAAITCLLLVLVACGDDDSDFVTRPSDDSSSSVCKDCDDESSSSGKEIAANSSSSRNDKSSSKGDGGSETAMTSSSSKVPEPDEGSSNSSGYKRVQCNVETDKNCMKDERDGQTYRTAQVGFLVWMAENLNFKTANSSCFNDSAEYCEKYGRIYTWADAVDSVGEWSSNGKGCGYGVKCLMKKPVRGICPEGWHLPDSLEWTDLFYGTGYSTVAGVMLKSTSGWKDDGNGTDDYGFSALPTGFRDYEGVYGYESYGAYYWSSTESYNNTAYYANFNYGKEDGRLYSYYENGGYSVRCLRDSLAPSNFGYKRVPCNVETDKNCMKDERDGQTYRTVKIGDQVWMAENLNFEVDSSFCYNDSPENCENYGRLYMWSAAVDSVGTWSTAGKGCGYGVTCSPTGTVRGVCPEGWHVPTLAEWITLITAAGDSLVAGTKLKSSFGWYNNGNGTDDFGFSVLPVGIRSYTGSYSNESVAVSFWSSDEVEGYYDQQAKITEFYWKSAEPRYAKCFKVLAEPVRCLQD